ncbi:hypothetical protein [Catellatospora sp. NPDC049609]
MTPSPPAGAGMPRWFKIFALVGVVLAGAFLIAHLTGNVPTHGGH